MTAFATALITGSGLLNGYVNFTEISNLTVHVSAHIEGFEYSEEIQYHGFHVHEYGDLRGELSYERLGQHFSPNCAFPPGNATDFEREQFEACLDFQVHGYPPSYRRMSGELGNLTVVRGVGTYDYVVRQEKMSLSDSRLSIIGRSMCVHENRDDGSQPYGNSGAIIGAGVIEAISREARAVSSDQDVAGGGGVAVLISSDRSTDNEQEIHVLLSESLGVRLVIKNSVLQDGSYSLRTSATGANIELLQFNVSQKFQGSYVTAETAVLSLEDDEDISMMYGRQLSIIDIQNDRVIANGVVGIVSPREEIDSAIRAAVAYYPRLGGRFVLTEVGGVSTNVRIAGSAILSSSEEPREYRGFHVHQYGDIRMPLSYERLGFHFIAPCKFSISSSPRLGNNSCFVTHGYPPAASRLNGELGNATVVFNEDGLAVATYDYVSRQEKMSLSDDLTSVLGRSLVVHELRDDGSPPWGNSGGASLAAVIEAADPADYGCVDNAVRVTTATTEAYFLLADFSASGIECIVALVPGRLGLVCESALTATLEIRSHRKSSSDASGPVLFSNLGSVANQETLDIDIDDGIDTASAAGRIFVIVVEDGEDYAAPLGFATTSALLQVFSSTGRLDCVWSDWSEWSECSGECGVFNGGNQNRSRTRDVASGFFVDPDNSCANTEFQSQPCYEPCPIEGNVASSSKKRTTSTAAERSVAIAAIVAVVIALLILGTFLWFAIHAAIEKFYAPPNQQDPIYAEVEHEEESGRMLKKSNNNEPLQSEGDLELQYTSK